MDPGTAEAGWRAKRGLRRDGHDGGRRRGRAAHVDGRLSGGRGQVPGADVREETGHPAGPGCDPERGPARPVLRPVADAHQNRAGHRGKTVTVTARGRAKGRTSTSYPAIRSDSLLRSG